MSSFAEQIESRTGFTDKQSGLAVKIVLKYEKQLAKLGIDVTEARAPQFKFAVREIDRSKALWIENDKLHLKFPYIEDLVKQIQKLPKESQGQVKFDRDQRLWELALTEYNLNWAISFSEANGFEIANEVKELMSLIVDCEQTPYEIKLVIDGDQLSITNAAPELIDYINNELGGLSIDNLITVIDHADILGFTVDPIFEEVIIGGYSPRLYNLMIGRDSKLDTSNLTKTFDDVIRYATVTDRWPVYIFEPNLSNQLLALAYKKFDSTEVFQLQNALPENLSQYKVLHFNKYSSSWTNRIKSIPLLITSQGMLYGGEKQLLLDSAEKIVYIGIQEVYNAVARGAKAVAG